MTDKHKCPSCPYYKQKTSYGMEEVKCYNTNCIHYNAETEVEND